MPKQTKPKRRPRVSDYIVVLDHGRGNQKVTLKVGHQSFRISYPMSKRHAAWFKRQAVIALKRMVQELNDGR